MDGELRAAAWVVRTVYGTIRNVHTTYAAAFKSPPIQKLGAENHMLQLNI
jgi:hypothetical protein